jgi:hypothetical protein
LSLDIVDVTGVHVVGVEGKLHKHRLDKDGKFIEKLVAVSLILLIITI